MTFRGIVENNMHVNTCQMILSIFLHCGDYDSLHLVQAFLYVGLWLPLLPFERAIKQLPDDSNEFLSDRRYSPLLEQASWLVKLRRGS